MGSAYRALLIDTMTRQRIAVLENGSETLDVRGFHDREAVHHVGLWLMASRDAILTGT